MGVRWQWGGGTTLDGVAKEGLSDEVIFKVNLKKRRNQLCKELSVCQAVRTVCLSLRKASAKAPSPVCWRSRKDSYTARM